MIRLAALFVLLANAAAAACAPPAMDDAILKDALRYNGYALTAWGLNEQGAMEELWLLPWGEWIVVLTTPDHCATVISRPSEFMGRLSTPSNDADTFGDGAMTQGEGA